ncbi:hypothetical protein JYK14_27360 [Siccirubricoccus sp. KC 17139]|uniref:Invasion associated locus B family protein n=1 Tax=Siccirubricoccus soli TaxID=2899147 RepID=A0ABT1DE02_9PROT|nr:hypothetical protein [Siccirubricoccus soli]MCO6419852.1 hypothetical protein [Siccirubricoccus soli]MCP2685987.1 hypothetical protein [Siccirubricoccus soli]
MWRRASLALFLACIGPAVAQAPAEIGSWRLLCATDRMTDRSACQMRHRDWVEPPAGATPGLALEVVDRGGRLVPVVTARDLTLEGASRGMLALTGTAQLRFPPRPMLELPCGLEGRSLICAPRGEDAARAEQELLAADRALVRITGLGSGGSLAEPTELRLAGTRDAVARFAREAPPAASPEDGQGVGGTELLQRLLRRFGW